jgi:hypothetical protein
MANLSYSIKSSRRGRSPEKILLHSVAAKALSHIIIIRLPLKRLKAPHFCKILLSIKHNGVPGSSVSIVSGYGLDDRAIEVRSPAEAKGFLLYPLRPDRF